jgi:plasmid stabilization system protein ParE
MTYKLVVTTRAKRDRDAAFEWYRVNLSHEFAARWYDGIAQAIESLRDNPSRCHKAHESGRFAFELYELLHGSRRNKHRILFRLEGDSVVILHLRHSSQRDIAEGELYFED